MSIYFDHNASAPLRPSVREAMIHGLNLYGNASSVHKQGRQVRKAIENARETVANVFDVLPRHVIFTSGATEANNLILKSYKGSVIVSAVEHDSVRYARKDAFICPVDDQGGLRLNALQLLLKDLPQPVLVSVMAANNETGVIQSLKDIYKIVKAAGGYFHTDYVQGLKSISPLKISNSWDYITVSAHKLGGPQGVGAIIYREGAPLLPLQHGGGQERFLRPGTENVVGIIGFESALKAIDFEKENALTVWRDYLESQLKLVNASLVFFGDKAPRLPNTSCFAFPGFKNETLVMRLDLAGIYLSAGSACASGKVQSSHVLKAMGVHSDLAQSALRISLGWTTTSSDIQSFLSIWKALYSPQERQGQAYGRCA